MLSKLKNKIGDGMVSQAIEKIEPEIKIHIDKILVLKPDQINDDDFYADKVVSPARLAVDASSSGVTQVIPGFKEKFSNAMFAIRDELIEFKGDQIALVDNFENLYPKVLMDALKS